MSISKSLMLSLHAPTQTKVFEKGPSLFPPAMSRASRWGFSFFIIDMFIQGNICIIPYGDVIDSAPRYDLNPAQQASIAVLLCCTLSKACFCWRESTRGEVKLWRFLFDKSFQTRSARLCVKRVNRDEGNTFPPRKGLR